MRLCNECGSAYKTVTDPTAIARLLSAGWREVIPSPAVAVEPITAPTVTVRHGDPLKYKERYLSWYVQCGSVRELREVLTHCGVAFERGTVKKDLQALLRAYIKRVKADIKEERGVDG